MTSHNRLPYEERHHIYQLLFRTKNIEEVKIFLIILLQKGQYWLMDHYKK